MNARKKTWVKLTRPALRGGNITLALCATAKAAAAGNGKLACETVYGLLLSNTELLDFHPGELQKPDSTSPPDEQLQVMIWRPYDGRRKQNCWTRMPYILKHAPTLVDVHLPNNDAAYVATICLCIYIKHCPPSTTPLGPTCVHSQPATPLAACHLHAQLLALYIANLARLIKFQGAPFHLELDFATAFAAAHLPGWGSLPFLSAGRVVRPSLVDFKVISRSGAAAVKTVVVPEKQELEQVRNILIWGHRGTSASVCVIRSRAIQTSPAIFTCLVMYYLSPVPRCDS